MNGATTSVASIDVGNAVGGATYTLNAVGANLELIHTIGALTQTETVTLMDMGANATQTVSFTNLGVRFVLTHNANATNHTAANLAAAFDGDVVVTSATSTARFRVGAEVGDDISLSFTDMRSSALGGASTLFALIPNVDAVSTTAKADILLASTDIAIAEVSTFRAKLGASQNQMESAINSVAVSVENLSASESRIRDADIAQVSSDLVARQIMQQAGVAVLAQANTTPQAVLALLQGN